MRWNVVLDFLIYANYLPQMYVAYSFSVCICVCISKVIILDHFEICPAK